MNCARILAAAAFLVFTATVSAGSMQFGSIKTDGLPEVRIGDDVEAVQRSLHTPLKPEEMESAIPPNSFLPKKTQLRLKTRGVWIFFTHGKSPLFASICLLPAISAGSS